MYVFIWTDNPVSSVNYNKFMLRIFVFQAKGIDIRSWERDELMQFINGQGFQETKGMVNYK